MNFWQPCRNFSRQSGMKVAESHLCNNLENFPSNTFFSSNTSGHVDCSSDNRNGKNFSKGCHHFIQSPKTTRKMHFFQIKFFLKRVRWTRKMQSCQTWWKLSPKLNKSLARLQKVREKIHSFEHVFLQNVFVWIHNMLFL